MPLHMDLGQYGYRRVAHWIREGHAVALFHKKARRTGEDAGPARWELACECPQHNPKCAAQNTARTQRMDALRTRYQYRWGEMGLEKSLLDIHRRARRGMWLGQHHSGAIYLQEAVQLLGIALDHVRGAVESLYAQEKLDLNGNILADFVPGFRLPREMAVVIFRVVGDPLGYPNGDAGDFAIVDCEQRIQKATGCESGPAAFGRDWPHFDRKSLAQLILRPVADRLSAWADSASRQRYRIRRRDLERDVGPLSARLPHVKTDVIVEYMCELLKLGKERAMFFPRTPRKPQERKTYDDATLQEFATELRVWADHFDPPAAPAP